MSPEQNQHAHPSETIQTDGRKPGDWQSRYPEEVRRQYYWEGLYVGFMLLAAMGLIFLTWRNALADFIGITGASAVTFNRYAYYTSSGLLGGTIYGIKYLYRVVAHGYWSIDRRLWRLLSPWLSLGLAFAIGAIIEAGWMSVTGGAKIGSGAKYVAIGFLIGYFSDSAVAKMAEIATVVFGSTHVDNDHHKDRPQRS